MYTVVVIHRPRALQGRSKAKHQYQTPLLRSYTLIANRQIYAQIVVFFLGVSTTIQETALTDQNRQKTGGFYIEPVGARFYGKN